MLIIFPNTLNRVTLKIMDWPKKKKWEGCFVKVDMTNAETADVEMVTTTASDMTIMDATKDTL